MTILCFQDGCSSSTPLGPSLEEKLFSSCDLTADKTAQVSFKSKQSLATMGPRAKVSTQFQSSTKSRNWAAASEDLSCVFVIETPPEAPPPAAETSPQTSSDSGETSAYLLDFKASSSLSLSRFAAVLTRNQGNRFISPSGKTFSLLIYYNSSISSYLFGSQLLHTRLRVGRHTFVAYMLLDETPLTFPSPLMITASAGL